MFIFESRFHSIISISRFILRHLDAVDVDTAHAAAAVDEEDEFPVNLPQVGADGLEVGAEVEHDYRVVEDVLVEPSANDIHLENEHTPGRRVRQHHLVL